MKESFKCSITPQELKEELIEVYNKLWIIKKQIDGLYEDYYHDITNESLDANEVIEYYLQFNLLIRAFNDIFWSDEKKEKFVEFIDDRETGNDSSALRARRGE